MRAMDVDGDGKVGFSDLKAALDTDGDGRVSVNELFTGIESTAEQGVQRIERVCEQGMAVYSQVLAIGALVFGLVLLVYGAAFLHIVLFLQAFKVSGLTMLKRGWKDLSLSYRRTRESLQKDSTVLEEAVHGASEAARAGGADLSDLRAIYRETMQKIQSGEMSKARGQEVLQQTAKEIEELKSRFATGGAEDVQTALDIIVKAVNPRQLAYIIKSTYSGVAASLASGMSSTLSLVFVGLSVGEDVADAMSPLVASVSQHQGLKPELIAWRLTLSSGVCSVVGVVLALLSRSLMVTLSTCTLASRMVLYGAEALTGIKPVGNVEAGVGWGLVVMGFYCQVWVMPALPSLVALVFSPALSLEMTLAAQ